MKILNDEEMKDFCQEALQDDTQCVEVNINIKALLNIKNVLPPNDNIDISDEFLTKLKWILEEKYDTKDVLAEACNSLEQKDFIIASAENSARISPAPFIIKMIKSATER